MKIGIIGNGEIGSSLSKVYISKGYDVYIYDNYLNIKNDISNCHILNICIPYTNDFVDIVNKYIEEYNPYMVVIHSTVSPGTTSKINGKVCHSPIRGLHPNLDVGIKTFLKYIGSDDIYVSNEYSKHLDEMGIKSYICKDSKTSEYSKLLDTTYYGLCISFHNEIRNLCENENIDFDEVMTIYNKSYNDGYRILEKENVIRPVLYSTGKIGGHCIVQNAEILSKNFDSEVLNLILKYK